MVRMTTRSFVALCAAAAFTCITAQGQWLNYPDPKTPRTKDGKPNLTAPAPRMNGKPDLSGVWLAERTPMAEWVKVGGEGLPQVQVDLNEITKHVINIFWDVKPGEEPMRPEGAALFEQRVKSGQQMHTLRCLPDSVPAGLFTAEQKMIQTPSEIVVLFSNITTPRQIYLDGRPLPKDPSP